MEGFDTNLNLNLSYTNLQKSPASQLEFLWVCVSEGQHLMAITEPHVSNNRVTGVPNDCCYFLPEGGGGLLLFAMTLISGLFLNIVIMMS